MPAGLKTIPLAIRDLALPVPRTGSIEVLSGYGRAATEGREIHALEQPFAGKDEEEKQGGRKIA